MRGRGPDARRDPRGLTSPAGACHAQPPTTPGHVPIGRDSAGSKLARLMTNATPRVGGSGADRHAGTVSKQRYLVLHDYGMGGLWWWIHARSVREVMETFAEVEVVTDPAALARAEGWGIDDVDIDDSSMPPGLDGLRAQRDKQR